jgi:xanthine dehydrogenase YagT iron-sulfur-binding subunit
MTVTNRSGGLSRRTFLSGSAIATTGTSLLEATSAFVKQAEADNTAPVVGPDATPITLKINGVARTLHVAPNMTLAEVLRGPLGLTGTKIACDRGSCSACTVWLDGAAVNSCMLLAIDVGDRKVTTIEGLAQGDELHPVQEAFVEHDAVQCGFCTPGLVMSSAALLAQVINPTADDVKAAISGHLCRCGTYPHVISATLAAAKLRKG